MLAPATLAVADRLIATLMTLVRAVSPISLAGGTLTFSELAAHALFERLTRLVTALVRITTEGPRARRAPAQPSATSKAPATPLAPNPLRTENRRLQTEPGWLLDALPDTAPAIAAELDALLADPAAAALFAAEPALQRTLNPLLRSLGLAPLPVPTAPPPDATPPAAPEPPPSHAHPLAPTTSAPSHRAQKSTHPTRGLATSDSFR